MTRFKLSLKSEPWAFLNSNSLDENVTAQDRRVSTELEVRRGTKQGTYIIFPTPLWSSLRTPISGSLGGQLGGVLLGGTSRLPILACLEIGSFPFPDPQRAVGQLVGGVHHPFLPTFLDSLSPCLNLFPCIHRSGAAAAQEARTHQYPTATHLTSAALKWPRPQLKGNDDVHLAAFPPSKPPSPNLPFSSRRVSLLH
ncbi:hypothetical protein CPAR01_02799 [Colletotrichum paranaense]|uniref:Uncharacterized protein n=1 Tax=Colletotrichum paranaense TaxID=1914294 RepID=A0ABQ9T0J4_9PEZI|nr:uncharacterized protein CPAR01_02799 [Colletotrichum paranaense]KAK1545297.1 hypothetical protein CPAR01_02799 [Colletotrichum paranaense]